MADFWDRLQFLVGRVVEGSVRSADVEASDLVLVRRRNGRVAILKTRVPFVPPEIPAAEVDQVFKLATQAKGGPYPIVVLWIEAP